MSMALLALSLMLITSLSPNAFAGEQYVDCVGEVMCEKDTQNVFAVGPGIEMLATAEEGSDSIHIKGMTTSDYDVTLTVISPNLNNRVGFDQITPNDDGFFETTLQISPNLWTENGYYTIKAAQGPQAVSLYMIEVSISVADGKVTQGTSEYDGNIENVIVTLGTPQSFSESGLSIKATGEIGSNEIMVVGKTDKLNTIVTLRVIAPNDNLVTTAHANPSLDGEFDTMIITGGPLWTQDGFYTVIANQDDNILYRDSAVVEIENGVIVPEFGTIAAMILAVAIIATIVVSSRSRLGIMPKY